MSKGRKGEATRLRLQDGVRNLLATTSPEKLTITAIVTETGIPVGSLYFHFHDKCALLDSVAEEDIADFFAYFDHLEDHDFLSALCLVSWRVEQMARYRFGNVRNIAHYLYRSGGVEWERQREYLAVRLFNLAEEDGDVRLRSERLAVIALLLRGIESELIGPTARTRSPSHPTRATLKAGFLVASAYRGVMGHSASQADIRARMQIVKKATRLRERNSRLSLKPRQEKSRK